MLKLKNGKTVRADTFFSQLNDLEHRLNAQGLSLRTMPRQSVLADDTQDSRTLETQTRAIPSIGPTLDQGSILRRINTINVQNGTRNVTLGEATPAAAAAIVQQHPEMVDRANSAPLPAPVLNYGIKKIHHEQPWNWNAGNSTIGVYLGGKVVVDGQAEVFKLSSGGKNPKPGVMTNSFSLSADAETGCHLLGQSATLAKSAASFDAPSDTRKPLNASLQLEVVGITVYNFNQNLPENWNKNDSISKTVGFGVPFDVPIGPFSLSGEIGARGDAGLAYRMQVDRQGISGEITPFVHTSAYGEVGAGIDLGFVGASAGVGCNLTLVNLDLDVGASAKAFWFVRFGYTDELWVQYNLNMLSGNVFFYIDVDALFWSDQWSWNLFNWDGISKSGKIVDIDNQGWLE